MCKGPVKQLSPTNPTPSFFAGQMPFLSPNQQCQNHYECVAPLVANSLQSGRFWARSTASVHSSPWVSRSFCTVFIQVFHSRPSGLFQCESTEGKNKSIRDRTQMLCSAVDTTQQNRKDLITAAEMSKQMFTSLFYTVKCYGIFGKVQDASINTGSAE